MPQVKSSGIDTIKDLLILSNAIGDKVHREKSSLYTNINEAYGSGVVTVTKISKDITNLMFDVTLDDEFELCLSGNNSSSIDFIYCLEGSMSHKFKNAKSYERINFRQNSIISRPPKTKSVLKFPANIPLKISITSYTPDKYIDDICETELERMREKVLYLMSQMYLSHDYRYLGRICFKTATFVQEALKYSFQTSAEILFKEAAILNILASQIDRHDKDTKSDLSEAPIRQSEIDKIIALENFISNNLSEDLSVNRLIKLSGLNASKLQKGFSYLFDDTICSYIKDKRLDKAATLIRETDLNVSEIVYSVGFSSRSYFTKIFSKRFGMLPSKCISNPELLMA
ncbi:MAG: hypothetical protein CMC76_08555 [Flavobacteriaceae bacterium]|nr:hypothetical protein [Flavobacteriaceae bacterium]|tara:strand:+ start:649 stop:1677 length:1029 start_codon:yes stop_codon:yes gene_type:complete